MFTPRRTTHSWPRQTWQQRAPSIASGLLVAAVLPLAGCRLAVDGAAALDERIIESSGLVRSRQFPGVFWTHSDSAREAEIYAVDVSGMLLQTFAVEDTENVDWEDIAIDDHGYLYVGDIGNNSNARRDLSVLRIAEPDPRGGMNAVAVSAQLPFRYPDQDFIGEWIPDFDAESLFWWRDDLYLLTKHRSDLATTLYRFGDVSGTSPRTLERIADFELGGKWARFGGMATAADLKADGSVLAVLTYHALFFFDAPAQGHDFLAGYRKRIDFDQRATGQCEAVAWDDAAIMFTNESGDVFRIERPLDPDVGFFP